MLEDYHEACSNNLTTFHQFRKLPCELRLMIWKEALPGPRTIHLVNSITKVTTSPSNTSDEDNCTSPSPTSSPSCSTRRLRPRRRRPSNAVSHCTTTEKCPMAITSLLHACHESRVEVLSRYQPLHQPKSPHDPHYRLHYFDPLVDSLFVDDVWPWVRGGNSKPTGLFNARHLSISCNSWYFKWVMGNDKLLGKGGLLKFKHLEELNIVFRILTDHEREKIMQYRFGHYMGPADMTHYLHRPEAPHDIAFPSTSVDIQKEPIVKRFKEMHEANPGWNIPKVKLVAWGTMPSKGSKFGVRRPDQGGCAGRC